MIERKIYFYAEDGDENMYFADEQDFLTYLKENDPCVCGAEQLSTEDFEDLVIKQH